MSNGIEPMAPTADAEPGNMEHVESYKSTAVKRVETLGTVRHRHEHTNEIILVPTPSKYVIISCSSNADSENLQ
jgi:hypothetical protein